MDTKWTSDSIHFMPEPHIDSSTTEMGGDVFYASRPYFVIDFEGGNRPFLEYCNSYSVIYRYPRLLSLCTILLEIGRGETLTWEEAGSLEGDLNANWNMVKRLAESSRGWGDFEYSDYRKAIRSCLNRRLFDEGTAEDHSQAEAEIDIRKTAIYDTIVQPLEELIKLLGFSENIDSLDPIDSKRPFGSVKNGQHIEVPPLNVGNEASLAQEREANKSSLWLDQLSEVNGYINDIAQRCTQGQKHRAIRIAVLDTGYDDEAVFFQLPTRRRRVRQWKDFHGDSEDPVDGNGHGTHTAALIMKVAPTADIYIARVTQDRATLRNCASKVAEVRI